MSQSSIATSLSAGVSARLTAVRGEVAAGVEKRLSFVDPEQRTIPLAQLMATDACAAGLENAARFTDLTQAVLVYDVLVAQIQNTVCTKADASGDVTLLGEAEAAAYSECVQESDAQVPLGFKGVPLAKVLPVEAAEEAAAEAPLVQPLATERKARSGSAPVSAGIEWVTLGKFEISKTEVTVGQYRACVTAGRCTAPYFNENCNWFKAKREDHPVTCVGTDQVSTFADWVGGRLPTGEEWAYAATNGGKTHYPWGDETPTCDRAVMDDGGDGCGHGGTWPVCSKPAGNSVHGLCDLVGNVHEWTQESSGWPMIRGGAWNWQDMDDPFRYDGWDINVGFRLARSIP